MKVNLIVWNRGSIVPVKQKNSSKITYKQCIAHLWLSQLSIGL